jgi:hypothetical protein
VSYEPFYLTENMSVGSSIIDFNHRALMDLINKVGGWLVKTISDAGLPAFPAERTDDGVRTMCG